MKKILSMFLAALLLVSSACCGAMAEEPVTIQFWNSFTGADGAQLVQLVERFNEENEWGITVEMDISPSFTEQLTAALAADSGPALVLFSTAFRFQYADYLKDVSDIFEVTGMDKSDFIQSYLDYCSEDEAMWLVPFQIVGYYLMWNKDLFVEAGLDPEVPPQTWEQWAEYAKAIANEDKNVFGSGMSYNYPYQIAHIIQRFGGLAVTKGEDGLWKANFAGNEGYVKFLNMYKDLVECGANPIEADTDPMLTAGQIGMSITGPWTTGGFDTAGINYGISLVPQGDAGDMNSVEVIGFAVTNVVSEAEQLAAYRFIQWWNTEDANGSSPALEWSVANGFPAYAKSVQLKDAYKASAKLVATSAGNPDAPSDFIVDSSFAGTNEILNDVIVPLMNAVTFEGATAEAALEAAQAAADAIVANYNK